MKILIVDDDERVSRIMAKILEAHEHEVHFANNARDGIAKAEEGDFDFAFVDYKMPGEDGIWFMQNVKLPKKTKVLLITGYLDRRVISEMFSLGASGYLIKPLEADEILRHIDFFSN